MSTELLVEDNNLLGSVGLVQTQFVQLFSQDNALKLQGGQTLASVTVAYETYGQLSAQKDNAIFICHALTGDAHAAGYHNEQDRKPGWWDSFIGPGRGLDTSKYFIICANVIGGCQGTTGPTCINPDTGRPYALSFPFITVGDMVHVHYELCKHLGVNKLLSVVGGSLGGMQVLEWAARYPESLDSAICLASAAKLAAQGIAFNAVGRRAIYADPNFQDGLYQLTGKVPQFGLALARMIAHITYLSEASIEKKFGRRLQSSEQLAYDLMRETEFQIESYLHYQGKRFVQRFDANSYLYLTRAMDYFDLADQSSSPNHTNCLAEAFKSTSAKFLIASYNTDWLFPTEQSRDLVRELLKSHKQVTAVEFESPYGHDAFLIEIDQLQRLVKPFLDRCYADVLRKK